jgi:hypothetical protein
MKTIVKVMLPMVAFALASAGAVSTKEAKEGTTAKPIITGYIQGTSITDCSPVSVDCSTVNSGFACMSSTKKVWLKNGLNQCIVDLYRPHL